MKPVEVLTSFSVMTEFASVWCSWLLK